jgi:methylated-DNA-protein-cysteine methyltransferase-like protein
MKRPANFFARVYAVVKLIPKGKVATYGQIAAILEHPRAARTVGWALNGMPASWAKRVPWQRVINAEGRISNAKHYTLQLALLKKEGIRFNKEGRCDLQKYLWEPPPQLRR